MPRRSEQVEGKTVLISPDDPAPRGARFWALVRARVIDEMTGSAPLTAITLESDLAPTTPRVSDGGLVGVVGVPRHVFQVLAAHGYSVRLTVRAPGYIPRRASVVVPNDQRSIAAPAPAALATVLTLNDRSRLSPGETLLVGPAGPNLVAVRIRALGPGANQVTFAPPLPAGPAFAVGDPVVPVVPDDFAPANAGDLALHREPVVLTGRTVRVTAAGTTILAGAAVRITGFWRTPPPANVSVPAIPPNLVSVHPALYADRAPVIGQLRRRNLAPVAGDDKSLLDDVPAGATVLRLSDRQNLTVGGILLIDPDIPDRAEHLAVTAIAGASAATLPARVTVDYPLAFPHPAGARVRRVTPQPLGATKQLTREALRGDTTVFLNSVTGLAAGQQARVTGGPSPDEHHELRLYTATSDADGYYRLPPLSRVAQVEIRAEHGALTPVTERLRPDYTQRENRLDLIFR